MESILLPMRTHKTKHDTRGLQSRHVAWFGTSIITISGVGVGCYLYSRGSEEPLYKIPIFVGILCPLWYASHFVTRSIMYCVETAFFNNALYNVFTLITDAARFVFMTHICVLFNAIFVWSRVHDEADYIFYVWQIIICLTIFQAGQLVIVLVAKMVAMRFYKNKMVKKLDKNLQNEMLIHMLVSPQNQTVKILINNDQSGDMSGMATKSELVFRFGDTSKGSNMKNYVRLVKHYSSFTEDEVCQRLEQVKQSGALLFDKMCCDATQVINIESMCTYFDLFSNDESDEKCVTKMNMNAMFMLFDPDIDGKVDKKTFVCFFVNVYVERLNLASSFQDTDAVIYSLEFFAGLLIHYLLLSCYFLVWGIDIVSGFSSFSTFILAFSFIFGESIQHMCNSFILLFVQHPYDIGDMVTIGDDDKALVVKRFSLSYTQFECISGQVLYFPNSTLYNMTIYNTTRASLHRDTVYVTMYGPVTHAKILTFQTRLETFCDRHYLEYVDKPRVYIADAVNLWRIVLDIKWGYSFNVEDRLRYFRARSLMLAEIQRVSSSDEMGLDKIVGQKSMIL